MAGLFAACANEDTIQEKEQKKPEPRVVATFGGGWAAPVKATASAKTRTTGTHIKGGPIKVEWTATDRIWAKGTDGTWYRSEPAQFASADHSQANFSFTSGNFGMNPEVRYVGNSSDPNRVTVPQAQSQTTLGVFSHLSASGDCGTAIAKGGGGDYEFTLKHKAAYICFYPRIQNETLHHNVRLIAISLLDYMYTNSITGTFDFTDGIIKNKTAIANSSISVTLDPNSAPIPSASRNDTCFYIAIRPSFASFGVSFSIKDPTTNVTTTITHTNWWTGSFEEGKVYDYTAWLDKDIKDYKYYMWDAKYDYWYGHWKADGTPDGNYATNNSDPRWYNEGSGAITATQSCKDCPNVNELCWYIMKGDPHWDTQNILFSQNGHLRMGAHGIWLKKKTAILRDNSDITENRFSNAYPDDNGTDRDWRTVMGVSFPTINAVPILGTPSNPADYFFLPALRYFNNGGQPGIGSFGYYWSSSGVPSNSNHAYYMGFNSSAVDFSYQTFYRSLGCLAQPFE